MADNNPLSDSIFREVDDDIKREKLENFWKEYGNTIIAIVVILILGTALNSFVRHYKYNQYVTQTDQVLSYFEQVDTLNKQDQMAKLQELTAKTKGGAGDVLKLQLAALHYQMDDLDAALAIYKDLADDAVHDIYEEMAELQVIRIRMDQGESSPTLIEELDDLIEEDSAFRFSARELLGLLHKKSGNIAEANRIFQNLSMNGAAPETLRQRASAYITNDLKTMDNQS